MKAKLSLSLAFSFLFLQACQPSSGGFSSDGSNPGPLNSCPASYSGESIFTEVQTASEVAPESDPDLKRVRRVRVDIESLKKKLSQGSSRLSLDLFEDRVISVNVERIQKESDKTFIITGSVAGNPLSAVSMALEEGVLAAQIHPSNGSRYQILYEAGGVHQIQELQDVDSQGEEDCLAIFAPEEEQIGEDKESIDQGAAASPVIDMLVTYTPAARARAGGTEAMKALILTGIADTNRAFLNSGVALSVRLVGIMALTQNETGNFSSDLSDLKGKSDGRWDSVHAERTRLGADQVTVVGGYPDNGVAGIGYIGAGLSSAFSISKVSAFSAYTFTHELGHNVGLQHSDGYVNGSGGFRTIMAYGSYPRILRFSNPSLKYNGYSTGDSNQNSAAILNSRGKNIAQLLPTKTLGEIPEIPVDKPAPTDPSCP